MQDIIYQYERQKKIPFQAVTPNSGSEGLITDPAVPKANAKKRRTGVVGFTAADANVYIF